MSRTDPQPDPPEASADRIARLELQLALAKELRAALNLPGLIGVLDDSFLKLFPGARWELLLPDAMTGEFRPFKHAEANSAARGQDLLEGSALAEFIRAQSCRTSPLAAPRPSTRLELGDGEKVELLPLGPGETLIGILAVWLAKPPTSATLDDLATAGEMIGHTLLNVQTYEQLHQQNITDDLTGLFNARHFHHLIDYEIERSRRYGHELSLIFIDLDFFKRVNDTFGHLAGSALLGEVGELFAENMRKVNLACRYGGDEFAILLPSTSKSGAQTLANILRQVLKEATFSGGDKHQIKITASFGIAAFPDDASSKEELIQLADSAMYDVKRSGRDGVRCV